MSFKPQLALSASQTSQNVIFSEDGCSLYSMTMQTNKSKPMFSQESKSAFDLVPLSSVERMAWFR